MQYLASENRKVFFLQSLKQKPGPSSLLCALKMSSLRKHLIYNEQRSGLAHVFRALGDCKVTLFEFTLSCMLLHYHDALLTSGARLPLALRLCACAASVAVGAALLPRRKVLRPGSATYRLQTLVPGASFGVAWCLVEWRVVAADATALHAFIVCSLILNLLLALLLPMPAQGGKILNQMDLKYTLLFFFFFFFFFEKIF